MTAIQDKIRKLLALAQGQANEHESARALELASRLMMQHGIDAASLDKPTIGESGWIDVTDSRWIMPIAEGIGKLYGVMAVGRGKHSGWNHFRFIGREDNREAAYETMSFVILQVEQAYKIALPKGLAQRERAQFRRDFKLSAAIRIQRRCHDIVATQIDEKRETGTALLVLDHRKQLQIELEDYRKQQGVKTTKSRAIAIKHADAWSLGRAAGQHVDLNVKVTG